MAKIPDNLQLRCFCHHRPLLAICGRDAKTTEPFIHVKTWKGQRLYTEVVVIGIGSSVRIRCRECLRWHNVVIRIEKVRMIEEALPESILV